MKLRSLVFFSSIFSSLTLSFLTIGAWAQENGSGLEIEEVVVTGTKREVSQQDLSIAVTTVTSKQLENTFRNDVTALSELAPNVNLTPQNGFNAIAGGMRGTGFISILVTKDPSVGITVDEFAFNHVQSQFIEMFDMEQVEIFRGPQGTLFGKNTTGGAVSFTTKKPVLGEFFGDVEVNFGQYASNDSDFSKLKFALNIPLGDTLAARLAVIKDESDGYYTNDKPMGGDFLSFGCIGVEDFAGCIDSVISKYPTTGDGSDIGGKDVLAAKLKFRFQPNDFYMADLIFEYVEDKGDTVAAANETPEGEGYIWPLVGFPGIGNADPFSTGQSYTNNAAIDIPGGHQIDADGIYLTQTFSLDNFEIKSITGVRNQEEILASTYTGEAYTSLYDASRNSERDQFQQEFRITSEFDGPFNFVAGTAYYEDDVEFVVFGSLGFYLPLVGPGGEFYRDRFEIQYTSQDRESTAIYADFTYDVNDRTSISAGWRYTKDEKDFWRLNLGGGGGNPVSNFISIDQYQGPLTNPLPESAFGNNIRNNKEWSANTYRLAVDYDVSDNMMAYASYATGFVAGGYSETCGSPTSCAAYEDEENDNFEVGVKYDSDDGKLRMNVAAFNTQYENLQRDTVVTIKDAAGNTFQETKAVNEGESTARGVEIEMTYVPNPNFRIDFNWGWLDHEYDSYNPSADPAPMGLSGGARAFDFSSLDVPYSPSNQGGLSMTYIYDMSNGSSLTYNVAVDYQAEFEINPFPANAQGADASGNPIVKQKGNTQAESRTLLNAYVTWESANENFDITLYGRNLTDETYRQSANPVATLWNFTRHGPPRQIGIQLGYSF